MSLINELILEKKRRTSKTATITKPLDKGGNIIILVNDLSNENVKRIIEKKGNLGGQAVSFKLYTENIRNNSVALILSKYGKVVI